MDEHHDRYKYNLCTQATGETIDNYLHRLHKLSGTCEYVELYDEMLRDQVVTGVTDNHIWARLLRDHNLTLQKALEICCSSELASSQPQQMDNTETAHFMRGKSTRRFAKIFR